MATTTAAPSRVERTTVRRATAAGAIGSFVEWYDYGIYGLLAGSVSVVFFPGDADSALLLTYAGFAVSFAIRPFGAAICGHLGDRMGRKRLLAVLILLISGATAAIGVLPTYAAIGWAAPALLILLRMLQGFSAGGEVAGAMSFVAEHAEDKRRGYTTSWLPVGSFVALLVGSLISRLLIDTVGQDAMNSWAWRVPFLIAVPLGAVGFYIRAKLEDTPRFQAIIESRNVARNPLKEALTSREHLKAIGLAIALPALNGPGYYIVFVYMQHESGAGAEVHPVQRAPGHRGGTARHQRHHPPHGAAVRPVRPQAAAGGLVAGHGDPRLPVFPAHLARQRGGGFSGRRPAGGGLRRARGRHPGRPDRAVPDPGAVQRLQHRLQHHHGPLRRRRSPAHDVSDRPDRRHKRAQLRRRPHGAHHLRHHPGAQGDVGKAAARQLIPPCPHSLEPR
ncbi:major facilitator family transporter [Streptomyces himastatinicus ATCC 53653]|uniref:Major facilitator family transporter n=1 Tax=Streptomyces himastatinicus ATCC 53653 TaxID=457427 RepID=D9W635_9ACTN|nr:major facilitator family transporter [Streptomyces himastatinicus ATCC 53653]